MIQYLKSQFKSFGRCYDAGLKDRHQVKQLHVISADLWSINNTQLPGIAKILLSIWCLTVNTVALCGAGSPILNSKEA